MIRLVIAALLLLSLGGCSVAGLAQAAVGAAVGGGPNVAANTNLGRNSQQTLGNAEVSEFRLEGVTAGRVQQSRDDSKVKADRVERVTVNEAAPGLPVWLQVVGAVFLWWLPSDREISRNVRGWLAARRRRRDTKAGA